MLNLIVVLLHCSSKPRSNSGPGIAQFAQVIGGAACWVFLLQQAGMRMHVNGPLRDPLRGSLSTRVFLRDPFKGAFGVEAVEFECLRLLGFRSLPSQHPWMWLLVVIL